MTTQKFLDNNLKIYELALADDQATETNLTEIAQSPLAQENTKLDGRKNSFLMPDSAAQMINRRNYSLLE